jgi:signal transduction histidine kinase
VHVGRVVESVLQAFTAAARERRIEIVQRIESDIPLVCADHRRLEQLFTNLIENALKVAPDGTRIDVSVERGDGAVRCTVAESGSGIDPAAVAAVLGVARQQEDGSRERRQGAVSLSIARHLAELHLGTITADRTPGGEGVAIVVELPIAQQGQSA